MDIYKKYKDEIIYFSLIFISLFFSIYFDLFDLFHEYTRQYEDIEVDEWFIALLPISIITIGYAIRKIHKNTLLTKKVIETSKKDPITSLANRFAFKETYQKNKISPSYLFLINVINFKDINHSFGITIGDKVLQKIALKLQDIVFQLTQEKLFRVYGDEFAFFATVEDAETLAKKLKEFFEKETIQIDKQINMQIDIAISYSNTQPKFQTALIAMQTLKKTTNESIVAYRVSSNYKEISQRNLEALKLLKEAKEKDLFVPYYQPIIDNKTEKIVKYETLIRIVKDEQVISPFEFLELSKKYKYYDLITKTIIKKSFLLFEDREEQFSINLSSMDISNPKILEFLFQIIQQNPQTASRMTIELVESENIDCTHKMIEFRHELQKYNVKLAIDDFGSGYANMITTLQLQPDYIKIDGSLIEGLLTDEKNYSFVEAIVFFAKKHKIQTIAEYVSSKELFDLVKKLDIDFSQGYYFSPPLQKLQ